MRDPMPPRLTDAMPSRMAARSAGALLPVLMSPMMMLALLGGCSSYVPVIPPALRCNTPEPLLQGCESPQRLRDGLSYAELLTAYQADRQALQRCATRQEALRQAVQTCSQAIDAHNAELGKLNDDIKARQR